MKLLLLFWLSALTLLAQVFGTVERIEGQAVRFPEGKATALPLEKGAALLVGDRLATEAGSRVLIRQEDGTIIAVGQKTTLLLETPQAVDQKKGEAYYLVPRRLLNKAASTLREVSPERFKVRIKTATIGTEFIVESDGKQRVMLNEGKLAIRSEMEAFHRYVREEMAEFEQFKQQAEREFEQFKSEQDGFRFVEDTEIIELDAGYGVSLDGRNAYERKMAPDAKEKFRAFTDFVRGR